MPQKLLVCIFLRNSMFERTNTPYNLFAITVTEPPPPPIYQELPAIAFGDHDALLMLKVLHYFLSTGTQL